MGCSLPQAENLPIYCTGLGSKHALQGSGALINGRQGQASRLLWVEGLLFFFFFSEIHSTPQQAQVQGLQEAPEAQHGG